MKKLYTWLVVCLVLCCVVGLAACSGSTITTTDPANGAIEIYKGDTKIGADTKVKEGTDLKIVLKPSQCYKVDTFTIDGVNKKSSLSSANSIEVKATKDMDVKATFVLEHTWGSWTVTTAPTCTTAGVRSGTCSVCGAKTTESIPATGHNYSTTEMMSDDEGHWYACLNGCGIPGSFAEHTFGLWQTQTAPACEVSGIEERACGLCGYQETRTTLSLGHNWAGEFTTDGDGHWYACLNGCGTKGEYEAHAWGGWTTVIPATCTNAGARELYCAVCGQTEYDFPAALGHNYSTTVWTSDATGHWRACANGCGTKGSFTAHTPSAAATCTTAQTCTVAGCGYVIAPALGHTPGAAATCTTAQTCTVCKVELAPALGHDWSTTWTTDATNHWYTCSRCTEKNSSAAHTPGDAANCTDAQICTICERVIKAALGHTKGAAATCTEAQYCTVCHAEIAPPLGHDWAEEWSSGEFRHWHECLNGCGDQGDSEFHTNYITGSVS